MGNSKKNNSFLLTVIHKLSPEDRCRLIEHLNNDAINLLCESIRNVVNVDVGLPKKKQKYLKRKLSEKSKGNILSIANKKTSLAKRRKLLEQEGGSIGLILAAAIPLISSLISRFTRKK